MLEKHLVYTTTTNTTTTSPRPPNVERGFDPLYVDRLVDAPEAQFQVNKSLSHPSYSGNIQQMKLNNKKINAERDKLVV
tara:strand:+ start:542 stop:778 length:237 start_codon:yes stop_codon:yes gene_type:complete